jgi:hypothetical protein
MERFIRDFGFFVSLLLLPAGVYCLRVGSENRGSDATLFLIGGAALASGGFLAICSSIQKHFIMRNYVRHAHGKERQETSDPVARS